MKILTNIKIFPLRNSSLFMIIVNSIKDAKLHPNFSDGSISENKITKYINPPSNRKLRSKLSRKVESCLCSDQDKEKKLIKLLRSSKDIKTKTILTEENIQC